MEASGGAVMGGSCAAFAVWSRLPMQRMHRVLRARAVSVPLLLATLAVPAPSDDCNRNGVPDSVDVSPFRPRFGRQESLPGDHSAFERPVVVADLDSDGYPDVAAIVPAEASGASPLLVLWRNRTDGTFDAPRSVSLSEDAKAIATGDTDGDGRIEVVAAGGYAISLVSVADGWDDPQAVTLSVGSRIDALAVADMNSDGLADLIIPGAVLLRSTSLEFTEARFDVGGEIAAVGDLDSDGDPDAVLRRGEMSSGPDVILLENDGHGQLSRSAGLGVDGLPRGIVAADLDGDGVLDLAVCSASGSEEDPQTNFVRVFRNEGAGAFGVVADVPLPLENDRIAALDVEGDGDLDLATGKRSAALLLNEGTHRFATWHLSSDFVWDLQTADVDGDDRTDIVILSRPDPYDVLPGAEPYRLSILRNSTDRSGSSRDCDRDGVPDECQTGLPDCDGDGIADPCQTARPSWPSGAWLPSPDESALTATDLDGDGSVDLVSVRDAADAGELLVRRGTGTGRFSPPIPYRVGRSPESLVASDLDGDGRQDVAVLHTDTRGSTGESVLLLFNDGDLHLAGDRYYRTGTRPVGSLVRDLDGNGNPDVLVANRDSSDATVLWNSGGRSFGGSSISLEIRPVAFDAADLTGDGRLDLVVVGTSGAIRVFENEGGAIFAPSREVPGLSSAESLEAADVDGDGDCDLVVANGAGRRAAVLRNRGSGAFEAPVTYSLEEISGCLTVADLDGDGLGDLLVGASDSGWIEVLLGTGGGSFAPSRALFSGEPVGSISVADVDRDGRADIVTDRVLMRWTERGIVPDVILDAERSFDSVEALDVDGDGWPDLAASDGGASIYLFRNAEGRVLEPYGRADFRGRVQDFCAADLEGDGDLDLVVRAGVRTEETTLQASFQDASGSFGPSRETSPATAVSGFRLGDLDGDHLPDLVSTRTDPGDPYGETGFIDVHSNVGDGTFSEASTVEIRGMPRDLELVDLDADGDLDAVVPTYGGLRVLRWDAGAFASWSAHPATGERARSADMDLDGDQDLIISGDDGTRILLNSGDGTLDSGLGYPGLEARSLGDLDGDGLLDAILRIGWMPNAGGGLFAGAVRLGGGSSPSWPAALDFDRDGSVDLVASVDYRYLVIFPGAPSPPEVEDRDSDGVPDSCRAGFHRGDSNGDGLLDISDPIATLRFLFLGSSAPGCLDAADATDDERLDVSDAVFVLRYLFQDGPPPPDPGPPGGTCGPDTLDLELGCATYSSC